MKKILIALGFTMAAMSAQAITLNVSSGPISPFVGVTTIDFDSALPSGVSITGGEVYAAPTQPNISAVPVGSTGNYYSVGISPVEQQGPGIVTLADAVGYYGFLWGSVDSYNKVTLLNGSTIVKSFTGDQFNPNDGDQNLSIYLNIFADNTSEFFNTIVFESSNNAFETDNHAYASAVPVPAALPLLASALGAFGIARRRNKAKAAK